MNYHSRLQTWNILLIHFFQRDKNKELEAKNRELERKLKEEVALREKAEARCMEFRKKLRALTNESTGSQTKTSTPGSSPADQKDASPKQGPARPIEMSGRHDGDETKPAPKSITGTPVAKDATEAVGIGIIPPSSKQQKLPPAGANGHSGTKGGTTTTPNAGLEGNYSRLIDNQGSGKASLISSDAS